MRGGEGREVAAGPASPIGGATRSVASGLKKMEGLKKNYRIVILVI
jgi:hypothetical protein